VLIPLQGILEEFFILPTKENNAYVYNPTLRILEGYGTKLVVNLDGNHLSRGIPSKLVCIPSLNTMHFHRNNLSDTMDFPKSFYRILGRHLALVEV
jgi:hypothetical protein